METRLTDGSGKPVAVSGTGSLMPTGHVLEDTLWLGCRPIAVGEDSSTDLVLNGPCDPGVYRITQTISHNGKVVTQQVTGTIRFND